MRRSRYALSATAHRPRSTDHRPRYPLAAPSTCQRVVSPTSTMVVTMPTAIAKSSNHMFSPLRLKDSGKTQADENHRKQRADPVRMLDVIVGNAFGGNEMQINFGGHTSAR